MENTENTGAKKDPAITEGSGAGITEQVDDNVSYYDDKVNAIDNRQRISVSNIKELHKLSELTLMGIIKAMRPVYQMDGIPVRVRQIDGSGARIEPLNQDSLRHEASQSNCYLKIKTDAEGKICFTQIPPPVDVIKDALASTESPLPSINGILSHPTISENGKVIHKPGYNAEIKLYIDADAEILKAAENISATPTTEEIDAAVRAIDEVILDFPFKSESDRAGYFAMLLTLLFRPLISGSIPLFLIRAPTPGTGKTLIGETSIKISSGHSPAPTPWTDNDEELKKTLHSSLLSGAEYIFIDNVNTKIKSGILAAIATSRRLNCRILGVSKMASVPCNAPIIITANNPDLSREIARRCVPIELVSDFENPSERTGFKYPDLNQYITDNRPELVRACLVMARAWFADENDVSGVNILSSFEDWSKTIGGILKSCGVKGFLENTGEFFSAADGETENLVAFVQAWHNKKGNSPAIAKDILPLAMEYGLISDKYHAEGSQVKALGRILKQKQDMVFSGIKIVRGLRLNGIYTWKTINIKEVL